MCGCWGYMARLTLSKNSNSASLTILAAELKYQDVADVDVEKLWAHADASMPISSILPLAKLSNTIITN